MARGQGFELVERSLREALERARVRKLEELRRLARRLIEESGREVLELRYERLPRGGFDYVVRSCGERLAWLEPLGRELWIVVDDYVSLSYRDFAKAIVVTKDYVMVSLMESGRIVSIEL